LEVGDFEAELRVGDMKRLPTGDMEERRARLLLRGAEGGGDLELLPSRAGEAVKVCEWGRRDDEGDEAPRGC